MNGPNLSFSRVETLKDVIMNERSKKVLYIPVKDPQIIYSYAYKLQN